MMRAAKFLAIVLAAQPCQAAQTQWLLIDEAHPEDAVDESSVVRTTEGLVQFWLRHGVRRVTGAGKVEFPTYTFREVNCGSMKSRDLKYDYALEDQDSADAVQARADFLRARSGTRLPTDWKRVNQTGVDGSIAMFVCQRTAQAGA